MVVVNLLIPISSLFVWSMAFNINFLALTFLNRMVLLRENTGKLWKVVCPCFIILIFLFLIGLMPLVLLFIFSIGFPLLFWILFNLGKNCMVTNHHFMLWKLLVVLFTLTWVLMFLENLILSLVNSYFLDILLSPRVIFV